MSSPLVTIMIPCYNQASSLPKAIESALAQSYVPLEVVVSDDASNDATVDVVRPYLSDPRLRYERATANRGRVGNYRHTLESLARGTWTLNLDGDDFLTDPAYVAEAMKIAATDASIVMVFGRQKYLDALTGVVTERPGPDLPTVSEGPELLKGYFSLREGVPHLSALYRREAALRAGVFQNDIVFADAEAILRILAQGRVGYTGRIAGTWVDHGGNASHGLNVDGRLRNLEWIAAPARDFAARGLWPPAELARWKAEGLNRAYREAVYFYIERGGARVANEFQSRARALYPEIRRSSVLKDPGFWLRVFFPRFPEWRRKWRALVS